MSLIPVIDFASFGLEVSNKLTDEELVAVGEKLYDALRTCGFAYLKNSGISKEDVASVNDVTEEFFSAPLEQKMKYVGRGIENGYIMLQADNVDPSQPHDYKEGYIVMNKTLDNPQTTWPTDISKNFPVAIKNLMIRCRELTLRILKALGAGMKLVDSDYFVKCHSGLIGKDENHTAMRANFYPPLPRDMAVDHIRLGRHSDYGSITLLFQDSIGGLQIESPHGEFIDAVPIEDTVLINGGDMLQSWSRNKLKSTKHRVVNPKDPEKRKQIRQSFAYFVQPNDHVLVDEELVYQGCPVVRNTGDADTPKVTAIEYLGMKLAQIGQY